MKRYCFFCGEEINDAEDYYELDFLSYYFDVFEETHGYKRIEKNKYCHKKCIEWAKIYYRAMKEGEI